MLATQIIEKKRDGCQLSPDEIRWMVQGVTDGSIPDYQISAWAMAVLCRGMDSPEIATLTECMLASGSRLQRCSDRPRVDKHSTGGLGDKTSLVLAPLLACFDLDVPMLSGRGLGITGGTLDKLESYDGYRCDLQSDEINGQLRRIGCVITGTTSSIAPADRKLYALRDVTGTVPSIALITASIMSKKLAETLDALVLDIKWGSAAFMKTLEGARQLEASLVGTGRRVGLATSSLLTDMNQPLGNMVGNACEANEAVQTLSGQGPADLLLLTIELGAQLLIAAGRANTLNQARQSLQQAIDSGAALNRYQQLIEAQGGRFVDRLSLAREHLFLAPMDGYLSQLNGQALGHCVVQMGGGRRHQKDSIHHQVGLQLLQKIGDQLEAGQPLMKIYSDATGSALESIISQLGSAITILEHPPAELPLIVNSKV